MQHPINCRSMAVCTVRIYEGWMLSVRNAYHTITMNISSSANSDEIKFSKTHCIAPNDGISAHPDLSDDRQYLRRVYGPALLRGRPPIAQNHQSLPLEGVQPSLLTSFSFTTTLPSTTFTFAFKGTSEESVLIQPTKSPVTP